MKSLLLNEMAAFDFSRRRHHSVHWLIYSIYGVDWPIIAVLPSSSTQIFRR